MLKKKKNQNLVTNPKIRSGSGREKQHNFSPGLWTLSQVWNLGAPGLILLPATIERLSVQILDGILRILVILQLNESVLPFDIHIPERRKCEARVLIRTNG